MRPEPVHFSGAGSLAAEPYLSSAKVAGHQPSRTDEASRSSRSQPFATVRPVTVGAVTASSPAGTARPFGTYSFRLGRSRRRGQRSTPTSFASPIAKWVCPCVSTANCARFGSAL